MNKKNIIVISCISALIIGLILLVIFNANELSFNQQNDYIEQGNKEYDNKAYKDAAIKYIGALSIDSTFTAMKNKANTTYRESKYVNSRNEYQKALSLLEKEANNEENLSNKKYQIDRSGLYHNIGNTTMKNISSLDTILATKSNIDTLKKMGTDVSKMISTFLSKEVIPNLDSIKSPIRNYKEALRANPKDDSTRYNLAIAQNYEYQLNKILEELMPPGQGNSNQNNKEQDKDKDKDKKDQKDQQDQKDNKDDKNEQTENTDEKNKQKEEKPNISKESAEQILEALNEDEKELQEKIKIKKQQRQQGYKTDKDW